MEKRKVNDLIAAITVLSLIILGLCAYIFVDFRVDEIAAESELMMNRTGMNGCARVLLNDISDGDMMLAYHHAASAAEYAYRAGESDSAEMFDKISASVLSGDISPNIAAEIDGFLASGTVPEQIPYFEADGEKAVPVSADAYKAAEKTAEKFFGSAIMSKGEQLSNGAILFSVSNAYAVIDGEKCVPIEAVISLPAEDGVMTGGECVTAALKFLSDFFPKDVSSSASVVDVTTEPGGKRTNVSFVSAEVNMTVTVRRDTGRVVRFVSEKR